MEPEAIFGPFFAMIALTFAVWVYMFVIRTGFITAQKLGQKELSIPGELARRAPAPVANPSDNLKNLFEIPVLFYALVLYLYAAAQVDVAYVYAAWIFVGFRALHSLVHCTINIVMLRFLLYLVSGAAVFYMAARAAFAYFNM